MNKVSANTAEIRNVLEPLVGLIAIKTYFSYYGLFVDNIMFGLYKDGQFYLKITEDLIEKYNISFTKGNPILVRDFHFFDKDRFYQFSQNNFLSDLITDLKQKQATNKIEKSIRHLPNMNINLERLLQRHGINTIDDLYNLGEIQVFVKLIEQGVDVAEVFLFKLHGALHNKLVYILKDEQKQSLLRETDAALYDAGLRKRFSQKIKKS
ncbi:Regulator of competence-specific genes [Phocoenobacter uteri]|uniref:Regulator of competence-specific genes n=1 Tax=Phocoenobacter uteri TaxID=146806 RepID=A0A379CBY7_9PAST|nr:TfoX/Sxy family DNA transformation protein [Phocoenobacter uteri]MDG6881619.1 hypothetical protein [Phocoenobacter uteri]SUB59649.1 Regulator of competence-specific genes [Phocoenobacter uteri]